MSIFEDDAINDDFEIEITDLPTNSEENRILNALAALRSRISFSLHSHESNDEVADDDLDVEITDLPTNDDTVSRGRLIAPIADVSALGLRITNPVSLHSHLPRKTRLVRQALVGIAILFMLAVVLGSVPSSRDALLGLFPRPTQAPTPAIVRRAFGRYGSLYSGVIAIGGAISISSTPIAGTTVIPWNPNTPVSSVLNPAPATCPSSDAPQDPDSTDFTYGSRVGELPLWVMGFRGVPTRLIGFTRANLPQYGWVHQVTLLLADNADSPVMLQGEHLKDGTPILFSGPSSQQHPTTFLTLRLDDTSIPNTEDTIRAGIQSISLYIPTAGCYSLKASWAGGSWEVLFAAGQ